jgi:protein gp37
MSPTKIHWTDETWNPTTGCDRTRFAGCLHCYALEYASRLKAQGSRRYQVDGDPRTSGPGFGLTLHPDVLDKPRHWRDPRRVFVNSMSDLGHPGIPDEFLAAIFDVMAETPRHTYQILTKRPHRIRAFLEGYYFLPSAFGEPLPNVWIGTSVAVQEDADTLIPVLLDIPAAVRFISAEPLLGPITLKPEWLPGLSWLIAGGESGTEHRPMDLAWPRSLRDQCLASGVSFFFKQSSARYPGQGRELDGRLWEEYPA